jgi:hypothetical protein
MIIAGKPQYTSTDNIKKVVSLCENKDLVLRRSRVNGVWPIYSVYSDYGL